MLEDEDLFSVYPYSLFQNLDFIFGELDTCVNEAGGHKGETAARACRLALVGPHACTSLS